MGGGPIAMAIHERSPIRRHPGKTRIASRASRQTTPRVRVRPADFPLGATHIGASQRWPMASLFLDDARSRALVLHRPWWRAWVPLRGDWGLLALYAIGFAVAQRLAAEWGGVGYYSLWFPAAGLRLAVLWRAGVRLTPALAMVELGTDVAIGAVTLDTPHRWLAVLGVVRPVVVYGLTVLAVRRLASGTRAELLTHPMPFALACVIAPIAAPLAALPQAMTRPDLTLVDDLRQVVLSLSAFAIGDLLGVLLVAPALLWIGDVLTRRARIAIGRVRLAALLEVMTVLGVGLGIAATLDWVGLGLQPAPALMAIAWVGLRFGRAAAWGATLLVCAIVLPDTAGPMDIAARIHLHLGLATLMMVGYLAGSFADARAQARADLERRDRMLFQAERLKTLRAMSVAVIHEVSQPLSTLAIEARHLREITAGTDADIAEAAALIDRKATHLSTLVRRLRRYGGRAVDEPSPLPLSALVESVIAMVRPEAAASGVRLAVTRIDPDLAVMGQEVELAQALVNLMRNAVQASGDGTVTLGVARDGNDATITVINRVAPGRFAAPGMGVGSLVALAIVEAHGGTLARATDNGGLVRATLSLPLTETGQ
jgi:signal transduction histidine kinase